MVGILLMSHGHMAEGMLDSCKLFFGDDLPQVKALCLVAGDNPEDFDKRIEEAIKEIDDGSGVVGMCDLFGGTPSNRCAMSFLKPNFKVITGMNFTMLLELLGKRMCLENIDELDINELMEVGTEGIKCLNDVFADLTK